MYKAVLKKNVETLRKHRNIKLVTTKARKDYFVPEANYHPTSY